MQILRKVIRSVLFDFQDNNPPGYKAPCRPSTEENVRDWLKSGKYFEFDILAIGNISKIGGLW